jgi:hypothetical protein
MTEAVGTPETLLSFYQSTVHSIHEAVIFESETVWNGVEFVATARGGPLGSMREHLPVLFCLNICNSVAKYPV